MLLRVCADPVSQDLKVIQFNARGLRNVVPRQRDPKYMQYTDLNRATRQ